MHLFRITCLLGIDRRRLEADEGAEAEQDRRRQRAGEHGRRVEEIERQRARAALGEDGEIDDEHDEIFEQHQHDHHLGREIDLAITEDADEGDYIRLQRYQGNSMPKPAKTPAATPPSRPIRPNCMAL